MCASVHARSCIERVCSSFTDSLAERRERKKEWEELLPPSNLLWSKQRTTERKEKKNPLRSALNVFAQCVRVSECAFVWGLGLSRTKLFNEWQKYSVPPFPPPPPIRKPKKSCFFYSSACNVLTNEITGEWQSITFFKIYCLVNDLRLNKPVTSPSTIWSRLQQNWDKIWSTFWVRKLFKN